MGQGRKTALRLTLPEADRRQLQRWRHSRHVEAGLARRARLILLVAEGLPLVQVARLVDMTRRHVYRWAQRYLTEGLACLHGDEERARVFQYARHARVRWAGQPAQAWIVVWQRITYRDVLGPVREYGLAPWGQPCEGLQWAYEADVGPWEEKPCAVDSP